MNAEDLHAVKCAVSTTIARFGALGTSHQWTSVVKPAVQRHLCNSQVEEIVCYCLGNYTMWSFVWRVERGALRGQAAGGTSRHRPHYEM